MDSMWDGGEPANTETTDAPIRGILAPSGAVVIDSEALADTFTDAIDRFMAEVAPDDWQSEDLAQVLIAAIQRTAR